MALHRVQINFYCCGHFGVENTYCFNQCVILNNLKKYPSLPKENSVHKVDVDVNDYSLFWKKIEA